MRSAPNGLFGASHAAMPPIDLEAAAEDALVARPEAEVEVHLMLPGGARFLEALVRGQPLAEATPAASRTDPSFDLTKHLAALLERGLVTAARLR